MQEKTQASNLQAKYEHHKKLCDYLPTLYVSKNTRYKDSFGKSYRGRGPISAMTRIGDKWNRLEAILLDGESTEDTDETVQDTLLDLANYCLMLITEIDAENELVENYDKGLESYVR